MDAPGAAVPAITKTRSRSSWKRVRALPPRAPTSSQTTVRLVRASPFPATRATGKRTLTRAATSHSRGPQGTTMGSRPSPRLTRRLRVLPGPEVQASGRRLPLPRPVTRRPRPATTCFSSPSQAVVAGWTDQVAKPAPPGPATAASPRAWKRLGRARSPTESSPPLRPRFSGAASGLRSGPMAAPVRTSPTRWRSRNRIAIWGFPLRLPPQLPSWRQRRTQGTAPLRPAPRAPFSEQFTVLRHGGTGPRPGLSRPHIPGPRAGGADVLRACKQLGRLGAPARRGTGAAPRARANSSAGSARRLAGAPGRSSRTRGSCGFQHRPATAVDTGLGLRHGHCHPRGTRRSHHDEASSCSVLLATGSCQLRGFSVAARRCQPTSRSRRRLIVNYFLL